MYLYICLLQWLGRYKLARVAVWIIKDCRAWLSGHYSGSWKLPCWSLWDVGSIAAILVQWALLCMSLSCSPPGVLSPLILSFPRESDIHRWFRLKCELGPEYGRLQREPHTTWGWGRQRSGQLAGWGRKKGFWGAETGLGWRRWTATCSNTMCQVICIHWSSWQLR